MSQYEKRGREEANMAIDLLKQSRRDEATTHLYNALDQYEAIKDINKRRSELSTFASLAELLEFPDIATMAALKAIEIDKQLGNHQDLANDLLTYGNVQTQLGNVKEALSLFRQALDVFLENGNFADAASASTNVAGILGNSGKIDEAIKMMYQSLDYLTKQPFSDTEKNTRIGLAQLLEYEGRPPEEVFSVAHPIKQFVEILQPAEWNILRGTLEQTVNRYVQLHPETNSTVVKRDNLSGLFEG